MGVVRRWLNRSRGAEPSSGDSPTPPGVQLSAGDAAVLEHLRTAGADLTQPRHARYFLYFDSADNAQAAAERARSEGFDAEVNSPLPTYPGQWCLLCEKHDVVLDVETVSRSTHLLTTIADEHHGDLDGWEAST